jgi:hypothetical protein
MTHKTGKPGGLAESLLSALAAVDRPNTACQIHQRDKQNLERLVELLDEST